MKHVEYDYSSIQVNLPDALANEIITWGKKTIPENEIFRDAINPTFGRENESHITVLYGIHSNSSREIRQIIREQKPFKITLGKTRTFHNHPFDVVVIGIVDSPELFELNKKIRDSVKYTNKFRCYKPHVTIAYVKTGEGQKYSDKCIFNNRKFTADGILFSPTKGDKECISFQECLTFKTFISGFQMV